jgi:glycine oxidase
MDIAIAGAGVIGCAVAEELSRRGFRVHVFDARQPGAGATYATAGVLAPFIETPSPGPLRDLMLESFRLYPAFVAAVSAASGVGIEFRRCGTFELADSGADEDRLRRVADAARSAGLQAEWHEANRGLLIRDQGYVRVEQLIAGLRGSAERHGALFHVQEPIDRTELRGDGVVVHTPVRTLSCGALVVAAGSWSGAVVPEPVGVRPVRGQLLRLHWRRAPLPHILWSHDCYVVPWSDGTILVGATVEDVGFDERITAGGVGGLLRALHRLLPQAEDATFLEARAGLRPAAADGMPIIRPSTKSPRVIYATGHYRNGILLAPLTARLVADLLKRLKR